jgi:hypothetical protein
MISESILMTAAAKKLLFPDHRWVCPNNHVSTRSGNGVCPTCDEPLQPVTGETFVEHLKSTAPPERRKLIDDLLDSSSEDDTPPRDRPK